jgi:Uma2 family endonuclease
MNTAMTWEQICDDPHLHDLPYKIEQDRHGRIVMSPAKADHGRFEIRVGAILERLLPGWAVYAECGVDTHEGVKVPDVAAMPAERARRHRGAASLPEAPDICVEILSFANTPGEMDEKRRLYATRGCREFWTCSEEGEMAFYEAPGGRRIDRSVLCPDFPPLICLD